MLKILISIFLLIQAVFCQTQNAQTVPPKITSVRVLEDKSVKIQWAFNNFTNIDLKRYKIEASFDNWTTSIEWPAQLKRVESYEIKDPYTSKATQSNFECFNACIEDPKCVYAQRMISYGINCLLSDKLIENGTKIEYAESASVLEYTNEALITNLPLNTFFRFRVSVYDAFIKTWSNFSTSSEPIDTKIELSMKLKRTDWQKAEFSLTRNLNTASRYKFIVFMNDAKVNEFFPDESSLFDYQPTINYVNDDYSNPQKVKDITACQSLCKNDLKCVQYIYFKEDFVDDNGKTVVEKDSCFIRERIDVSTGVLPRPESEAWNLISIVKPLTLDNLVIDGSYRVQVECTSLLGFTDSSNHIIYNITGFAPSIDIMSIQMSNINLTWVTKEPLEYTRYAVFWTVNGSDSRTYMLTKSSDYIDSTETKSNLTNISKCFETCFNNSKCLAFTYEGTICKLKYSIDKPIACKENVTCGIIPEYTNKVSIYENYINTLYNFQVYVQTSFGANSYLSDPRRFTFGFQTEIRVIDDFIVRRIARLRCYDNYGNIETINWYKNGLLYDPKPDNAEFQYNNSYIYFNSVKRYHAGLYACEIVFKNGQKLMSKNTVNVQVTDVVPVRPVISSVLPIKIGKKHSGVLLQWNTEIDEIPVSCVLVKTFENSNKAKTVEEEICNDQVKFGYLTLNRTFTCDTYFMITLKNAIGYSESSNYNSFDTDSCYAPSTVENYVNNNHTVFFSITIVLICLTFILLSVSSLLFFALKKKRYPVQNQEMKMTPTTKFNKINQ